MTRLQPVHTTEGSRLVGITKALCLKHTLGSMSEQPWTCNTCFHDNAPLFLTCADCGREKHAVSAFAEVDSVSADPKELEHHIGIA